MTESMRPLTRHENQIRLLYEYADDLIGRMELMKEAFDRMGRLQILMEGVDGAPGLIEILEWASSEVARVERIGVRLSVREVNDLQARLESIERKLDKGCRSVRERKWWQLWGGWNSGR